MLHNNVPVNEPAVNTLLLQLLVTDTVGAGTLETIGAATPLPVALVHPLTVCVTVYVPEAVTVIEVVVAPVFHNKDPVKDPAVNVEPPQLFTTFTTGADGTAFTVSVAALELTEPEALVHTALYCLLLSAIVVVKVNVALVAPAIFVQVPVVLCCHCTVGVGDPVAAEVKVTLLPAHFVCDDG